MTEKYDPCQKLTLHHVPIFKLIIKIPAYTILFRLLVFSPVFYKLQLLIFIPRLYTVYLFSKF